MVSYRPSAREASSRSGRALVGVRRPGTGEDNCDSRLLVDWTDNLCSCPSRRCCSRNASTGGHSAREVLDQ